MAKSVVAVQKQPEAICKKWESCVPNKTLFLKAFKEQNFPVGCIFASPCHRLKFPVENQTCYAIVNHCGLMIKFNTMKTRLLFPLKLAPSSHFPISVSDSNVFQLIHI